MKIRWKEKLSLANEENFESEKQGDFLLFAITHTRTGEAIGCTEYSSIDPANRNLEIGGSWLRPAFHGTAANSEAKYLLLNHAFEDLGCIRVQFTANSLNERSRAALVKIGAGFDGVLRCNKLSPEGKPRDSAYYSIIANEWPEVKAALMERIRRKLETRA